MRSRRGDSECGPCDAGHLGRVAHVGRLRSDDSFRVAAANARARIAAARPEQVAGEALAALTR